jgi:hypothetical protein
LIEKNRLVIFSSNAAARRCAFADDRVQGFAIGLISFAKVSPFRILEAQSNRRGVGGSS